jgi:hypothetical protein
MTVNRAAPVITLVPSKLDGRRLAVENTIGTMRVENLEPDETTTQVLFRYAKERSSFLR